MSIMDVFGRGAMPQFDMRGAGASTPFRDLGTEALRTQAAGEELRALQEEKFSSDMGKVSDGLDYLKELMSPEDQEEELLEDLPLEAIIPMMGPSGDDEATGKFESGQTMGEEFKQAVTEAANLNEDGQALVQSVMDAGEDTIDYFKDKGDMFYGPLAPFMPKLRDYYDTAGAYIEDAAKAGSNLFLDKLINPYVNDPYELFEYDNTETGKPIFFPSSGLPGAPKKADGGRIGFEEGGGLFERTSQIPEMFTTDELPSDPLSQIVKMGMAVRAPLLDVVEMLGLGAKESARIVSDLVKQGYDVTEPIRDVASDAIADTAEFIQEDARDMGRFMSPTYYADRFIVPALRGEEARTDTETRLRKDLSNRGRSSATQERTEMLKKKLFEETFGKDTQGRSALARPVEIDLGDGISVDYADGGRVGLNTGGMPFGYTPFMNMQQGIDYYSQFANPTFGNAAVDQSQQQDQSSVADDVLGQEENLGTLDNSMIDPRGGRGPEDRMEGFRPSDNPLSFENPANKTTMKFVDGKLVYDQINPYIDQDLLGIYPGMEVPGLPSPLNALAKIGSGIVQNIAPLNRFVRDKGLFSEKVRRDSALKENEKNFKEGKVTELEKALNEAKIKTGYSGASRDKATAAMDKVQQEAADKREQGRKDRVAQARREAARQGRDTQQGRRDARRSKSKAGKLGKGQYGGR
tara:strand:+ start:5709 stop:7784 length:2076 start_codon:yes stop_codon:yes gene_type:complete